MATAKKPAAKTTKAEAQFAMPQEVKDWIDQASSRMNHMKTEIERLKEENKNLKRSHKLMEQRVMGMSSE
jgi:cell division septum initiation protein DivIVA